MPSESTPLLEKKSGPPSLSSSPTPTAYFLDGVHRRTPSSASAISAQEHETVNPLPSGAERDEFAPRLISKDGRVVAQASASKHMKASSIGGDLLNYLTLKSRPNEGANAPSAEDKAAETGGVGTLLIPRKVPVKVEPKVHLANERTFLTWLHLVATLAAASVTILKFAADESAAGVIFGLILLPASLAFLVYSLYQCKCLFVSFVESVIFMITFSRSTFFLCFRYEKSLHDSRTSSGALHRYCWTHYFDSNSYLFNYCSVQCETLP